MQGLVRRFTEQQAVWQAAAAAMAELDVLMALAEAAQGTGEGPMCRPHFLPEDADPVRLCVSNLFLTGVPGTCYASSWQGLSAWSFTAFCKGCLFQSVSF